MHPPRDFILQGGNTAFANRQKLLFDKLSDAEQECNKNKMVTESTDVEIDIDESNKTQILRAGQKRKSETKKFRGKESIFKRPEGPAPRALSRSIPDFHKNPHKWKKYSLDDVSNDDMTEESNTRAALSFLKELKARRSMEKAEKSEKMDIEQSGSVEQNQRKVVFKPRKIKTTSDVEFKKPESSADKISNIPVIVDHDDKPIFRSSKVIMPEYVVGQKHKKKNKKEKHIEKVDRLKQLKLDHLEEADEDEN
ncbi:hypothetical protein WH47_01085 [Habropoda laboriosa]|uniref:U5 small nuclear ribonucleoprotein TSSC4 n=1 Tax=Habropoda laboriosa TaxID=597456 RepID=A0A0L7R126_9HYME|nr:PREDICTED: uncharacterized protein LOC108573172 [Habropoda laboriosa]KOC64501.1 hypothetical protein WH47_01085 [Habropoda laboriosa]